MSAIRQPPGGGSREAYRTHVQTGRRVYFQAGVTATPRGMGVALTCRMRSMASRYVDWLVRHSGRVMALGAVLVAVSAALMVWHLPLRADLAYLLPSDAPSVRDAAALVARMPAKDTNLVLVVAPDPATRAVVVARVAAQIAMIDPALVDRIEADDAGTRAFIAAHRWQYAPLADLELARDTLAARVKAAKVKANPLFIDLADPSDAAASGSPDAADPRVAALKQRQADAAARLAKPAYVSADGTTGVIVIRTAFVATDVAKDRRLQSELDRIAGGVHVAFPSTRIGFAGGVTVTLAEQAALVRGVMLSTLITGVLVALVLFAYLRSKRLIALLTANLVAATILAFGIAALTVGHLNAATAFLGAIIAGNGVNYGILLVARYLELRRTSDAPTAMAAAIAGTLRPTLVASLGAAIAYGALAVTKFRGFADFAWIGGIGMLVCWVASFVLLPVLVLKYAPAPRRAASEWFGAAVARVFAVRRPLVACALSLVAVTGAVGVTWRYIANDPFEYDMTQVRSRATDAQTARAWLRESDRLFGRGLAGIAGQTFVAVDRADEVPVVVSALRAAAVAHPVVGPVSSILDAIPPDQAAKLAVVAELRDLIDEAMAAGDLTDAQRAELLGQRPPEGLRAVTVADLPADLAAKLTERDGSVGRIIAVKPGAAFDEYDGKDLIAFASAVREVPLPGGGHAAVAGPSVLFADVLVQIQHDGPIVTLVAAVALALMVLLVVGRSRRAIAVLAATVTGTLGMVAVCALLGLKINFLDFVALPITLGLGIDYAINIADRAAHDPVAALRSTGGAVLVCSLTTMIGYASLFVSDNMAIRGFGIASLVGEITCVIAAFVVVPAVVALRFHSPREADDRRSATVPAQHRPGSAALDVRRCGSRVRVRSPS